MTTCSFPRPSKFYPNWYFWLKKPSGNPAGDFALLPCTLKPNSISGLPDGKSQFGYILECNGKCWCILCSFEITYCQLVNVVAIWYILWPSWRPGVEYIFSCFGTLYREKSGNPALSKTAFCRFQEHDY
jgi:hypothetical protein